METFQNYAYYYNAFYQDKDYAAESLQVDIDFSVADIRTYEPKAEYDAVISLFHVMSY